MSKQSLSYKDAGVDINAGNALVEKSKLMSNAQPALKSSVAWAVLVLYVRYQQNTKNRF